MTATPSEDDRPPLNVIEGEPRPRQRYTMEAWNDYYTRKDAQRLPITRFVSVPGYVIKVEKTDPVMTSVQVLSLAGGAGLILSSDKVTALVEALLA